MIFGLPRKCVSSPIGVWLLFEGSNNNAQGLAVRATTQVTTQGQQIRYIKLLLTPNYNAHAH